MDKNSNSDEDQSKRELAEHTAKLMTEKEIANGSVELSGEEAKRVQERLTVKLMTEKSREDLIKLSDSLEKSNQMKGEEYEL